MNRRPLQNVWRRLAIVPLLLAAAGCAHDRTAPADATPNQASTAQHAPIVATPDLSPDARLELAEHLLQKGDAAHARVELKACLDDAPDSKAAREMLAEIETPLSKLYPKQYFSVTLGRSETLSGLAATYLGDPLTFYGLARYNNISQPAMIIAGEQIRIPATEEALAAQNGFVRGQAMAADQAPQAQPPADQASADSVPPPPAPPPAAKPAPPDPWSEFKSALARRQYSAAAKLADANNFDPRNGRAAIVAETYMRAAAYEKKTRAAAHARKAGLMFLIVLRQPERARKSFQLALSLNPSDAVAMTGLKRADGQVADEYYRRGFVALQRQDLDGAIAAWNIVLSINPNYRGAQLNRDEAIQLKANLRKLKG